MLSWPGKTAQPPPELAASSSATPAYAYASQASRPASPFAYQAPAYALRADAADQHGPAPEAGVYAAPPITPWYQRYGGGAAASRPLAGAPSTAAPQTSAPSPPSPSPPAPTSIYDPPAGQVAAASSSASAAPAAPLASPRAPVASAQADGETAHFYSLHRQYGLTPDPDPIPPQFFTQTADLGEPAGPSPIYKAASASGASTTAVHPVQSDGATSSLGQP